MDKMHPNDPMLRSFIDVDPSSDFPIQNLPYGVFFTTEQPDLRVRLDAFRKRQTEAARAMTQGLS